jgi:hypothetical protein
MRTRPVEIPETERVCHVWADVTSLPMTRWQTGTLVFSIFCASCRPVPIPPPDAGTDGGTPDAGVLGPFALTLVVTTPDGAMERYPMLGLETPVVLPSTHLSLESNRRLHNARIRVLDESDRALPSDDVWEDTADGLRYRIDLLAPLEAGHRYEVLVDAQSGATLDDGTGREIPEQRLEFRTSGERQRPKPPATPKRRHRTR